MCNREVKFGAFYRYAMARGADYIATGHYSRLESQTFKRGVDAAKDQSYFLWAVPKEVLLKTLFPLGEYHKSEVRTLATRLNLPVARKPDSQGICFLGAVSVKDFLGREFGDNPAILHTLGERVPGGFVVGKDVEKGTIEIGRALETPRTLHFRDANHLADWSGPVMAQYRYHGPLIPGHVLDVRRLTSDVRRRTSYTFENCAPLP